MRYGENNTVVHTGEKKNKRSKRKKDDIETDVTMNIEVDNRMKVGKSEKDKSPTKRQRKKKEKNLIRIQSLKDEIDLEEQSDGVVDNYSSKAEENEDFKEHRVTDIGATIKPCRTKKAKKKRKKEETFVEVQNSSEKGEVPDQDGIHTISSGDEDCSKGMKSRTKKAKKKRKKEENFVKEVQKGDEADQDDIHIISCVGEDSSKGMKSRTKKGKKKRKKEVNFVKEVQNSPAKGEGPDQDDIHIISSGDEDCSKGMKKWIMEYHQSRPGLKVLQDQIDDFITVHEAKLEEERKEREALAAEGGWTVVVHQKGRKKTTDSESGIAMGSVSQAAVENKMAKKKHKEVGLDFYRFQKREAQRNEIMMLQSKFEEDKKRLQELRAARKFRPY